MLNTAPIAPSPLTLPAMPKKAVRKVMPKLKTPVKADAVASDVLVASPTPRRIEGATPGCYALELTNGEYHSLPQSISCSGIKSILRSPAHFQAMREAFSPEPSDDLGTALHAILLEPERFATDYLSYKGIRRGKKWDEFRANNPGKIILTDDELDRVARMRDSVMQFDEFPIFKALSTARREFSVFWTDEETGVQCRVRFDALNDPFAIWDLKSCGDARPEAFVRQAARLDYDLQSAMYTEAARRFTGSIIDFIFVAVETEAPFGVWPHIAGASMLENGHRKFRRGLEAFKRSMDTQSWPSYKNTMTTLEFPRYAMISD